MKTDKIRELISAAFSARENAYAPYSDFYVGAALITQKGKIYCGANVENASYPVGICAERSAFSVAVSAGERNFDAIAIVGGKKGKEIDFCFPCGMCRQFMAEFCKKDFQIIVAKSPDDFKLYNMGMLLPETFFIG